MHLQSSPSITAGWPHLLESVRNIVVVDGQNELGAVAGCCLAVSPFTRHVQSILLHHSSPSASLRDAAEWQRQRDRRVRVVERIKHEMQDGMVQSRSDSCRVYPSHFYYGDVHAPASAVPSLLARLRCHDASSVDEPNSLCDVFVMIFGGAADAQSDTAYDSDSSAMHADVRLHRFFRANVRRSSRRAYTGGDSANKANHVNGTRSECGRLLLLVDDYSRATVEAALLELQAELRGWSVVHVRLPAMAPPGLDLGAAEAAIAATQSTAAGWGGVLPGLCAGVVSGVTRQLPFTRQQSVPFVPIDVALNMALCGVHLLTRVRQHRFTRHMDKNRSRHDAHGRAPPCGSHTADDLTMDFFLHTTSDASKPVDDTHEEGDAQTRPWSTRVYLPRHARIDLAQSPASCLSLQLHAQLPTCQSLPWGMFTEYLMDYLRRYLCDIRLIFAGCDAAIASAPSLQCVAGGLSDTLNFGPSQSTPFAAVEGMRAVRARHALRQRVARTAAQSSYVAHLLQCVDWAGEELSQWALRGGNGRAVRAEAATSSGPTARNGVVDSSHAHPSTAGDSDGAGESSYVRLLRFMGRARDYVPLLQYVALYEVDWGMYVRCVCRAVLRHMAGHLSLLTVPGAARQRQRQRGQG